MDENTLEIPVGIQQQQSETSDAAAAPITMEAQKDKTPEPALKTDALCQEAEFVKKTLEKITLSYL